MSGRKKELIERYVFSDSMLNKNYPTLDYMIQIQIDGCNIHYVKTKIQIHSFILVNFQ